MRKAASILREADASFEKTGFDNWNGGTDLYTLYLKIGPDEYAQIESGRGLIEQQITDKIKPVIEPISDVSVQIRPRLQTGSDWRSQKGSVTQITRRTIIDYFTVSGTSWSGDLDEVEFLARLYDMASLPSDDSRFNTASQDIWQHRVNSFAWQDDWIFSDRRFGLSAPDEKLLRFLAENLHPVVRKDQEQIATLLGALNRLLRPDGWELVEAERISDRPCFAAQRIHSGAVMAVTRARVVADALDANWMRGEIQRLLGRTAPGFAVFGEGEPPEQRPGIPAEPFGIVDAADGSVALWRGGELVGYGGLGAMRSAARAYAIWAACGLPGLAEMELQVLRAGAACSPDGQVWVEKRGGTVLVWSPLPDAEDWKELLGGDA